MITPQQLWRIRHQTMRPREADRVLLQTAAQADKTRAGGIYATIQNVSTHLIYQYLCEFVAATMEQHAGRELSTISVLSWGGGKGYEAYFLTRKGADVTLHETAAYEHTALWEAFDIKVVQSSEPTLPFDAGSFDAIVGFGVLEHVPYDYEALKELNRILKDDGLFFCFNLPNKYGYLHKVAWWRGVRYHDRLYSRHEAQSLLKRAGFNTVGRPWFRQLLPKGFVRYPDPKLFERIDLFCTRYTPFKFFATSVEFVARKQYAYTSVH